MRKKLIQILTKTFEEEGTWKDPRAGAKLILAPFRCDNCKYFRESPEAKPEGSCNIGPASHAMFIRPDFFCALFEEES